MKKTDSHDFTALQLGAARKDVKADGNRKTHVTDPANLTARALKIVKSLADLDADSAIAVASLAERLVAAERCLRSSAPPSQ